MPGVNPETMHRAATISNCGKYRYVLRRWWNYDLPTVCFVMLNPSTADANDDDPTIRKCIGFARLWGCGGFDVVNLFAYRATDPAVLKSLPLDAAVGAFNDHHIIECARRCSMLVAAWGAHAELHGRGRGVVEMLQSAGVAGKCLDITKHGHPRHPLYVSYTTMLIPYIT